MRLGIPRVMVPRHPGVLCAFGLLVADVVLDYSRSILSVVDDETLPMLGNLVQRLLEMAKNDLIAEGITKRRQRIYTPSIDVRYQGQAYELNLLLDATMDISEQFHRKHERVYGHALYDRAVEVVNLRVQAVGLVNHPPLQSEPLDEQFNGSGHCVPQVAHLGEKTTPDGTFTSLYERDALTPGSRFIGAALVFQLDSTIYVPAGWSARVDGYRNLILEQT